MKTRTSRAAGCIAAALALITALAIQSCSKSSGSGGSTPPPVIGGYPSSDSVAAANLIAYFPFDADANDHQGGLTATAVGGGGVTFTSAGVRGTSYQGTSGSYFMLPLPGGGAPFVNIGSYSESLWFKVTQQDTVPRGIFFVSASSTNLDEMVTEIEPYTPVSGDSLKIHTGFNDLASPAYQRFVPETFDTMAIGKWVHLAVTYDASTGTYIVYQNAVPMGTQTAFSPQAPASPYVTPNILYTDATKATILGPIGFTSDPPQKIIIGSWPDGLYGQAALNDCFVGQIDELRIFNKALSQHEVSGLFLNGQAGQ